MKSFGHILSPDVLSRIIDLSDASTSDDVYQERIRLLFAETGNVYGIGRITLYAVEEINQALPVSEASATESAAQKPERGELLGFSQIYGWKAPDIFEVRNEDAQEVPFHPYYTRWLNLLQEGSYIIGDTGSFPKIEQELLNALKTLSTFIIPDIQEGKLRGFISFDRLESTESDFSKSLQETLKCIGSFIFNSYRSRIKVAEKQAKIDNLNTQLQAKNQVLANLSHEIRTPMNGIVGLAEQLEDLENDLSKRSFLENIKLSAANLMEVLSGIAEFSKTDESSEDIAEDKVSIESEILPIVRLYEEKAAEKNLKLNAYFDDNLPDQFLADYHKIRNVLKNLIDNAIKFTRQGFVKVTFSYLENDQQPRLVIIVEDSGIGISKDKQSYVFEKYAQIEQGFTRSYSGIGLGLSIVKNTLLLLKGNIELESEAGKGSRFRVSIPVKLLKPDQHKHLSLEPEALQRLRILVVDDHPINRKVVTTILDKWSSTYEVAKNGLEAVELAEKVDFDIVLMDIQMPVMDGYEATRRIRQRKGTQMTILALTASILKEDEQHCIEAGMNGIIRKPFFPDNLRYWVYKQNTNNTFAGNPPVVENLEGSSSLHTTIDMTDQNNTPAEEPGNDGRTQSGKEPSAAQAVTNMDYLKDISDGNVEFMNEMINLFIGQSGGHIASLQQGIDEKDYGIIAAAAHKMKPVLGYVGIDPERSKIRTIETLAKEKASEEKLQHLIDELELLIGQANKELKEALDSR